LSECGVGLLWGSECGHLCLTARLLGQFVRGCHGHLFTGIIIFVVMT
jgi:hypothetical protein